jgi:hypothetical protein
VTFQNVPCAGRPEGGVGVGQFAPGSPLRSGSRRPRNHTQRYLLLFSRLLQVFFFVIGPPTRHRYQEVETATLLLLPVNNKQEMGLLYNA